MQYMRIRSILSLFLILPTVLMSGCSQEKVAPPKSVSEQPESERLESVAESELKVATQTFLQAALAGQIETVRNALAQGTDPNATGPDGKTALMLASFNGHAKIAATLIEHGADVAARDSGGRSALMYAATAPNPDTVRLLLEAGADINAFDGNEHWTALMFAAAEGCGGVADILLEHGAATDMKDVDGDTAADFARQRGHADLADRLDTGAGSSSVTD